ncbi:helix-turn-helix domain-containing protein [Bacillus suaedaesalsae]|uniref:Helix-turn-helix transcriptional regulator n=1 Tax=Bacillus suaedaesalsae TaxID=2810349 RepID=A0ABS2DKV6_9BACI|nr:helix-turn-helix domain-containing protein [Bacillus suaedaesalsae]MBM6619131.1 helix-turn-helix transcriptional regulator [Bacillus suaedaesalsae]
MSDLLGKKIKELREYSGLSQRAVCRDICTQPYISKIENGEIFPSADLLLKISERLNVNISYLLDISNAPRYDYMVEVFTQIREEVYKRNYKLVKEIIKSEKRNNIFADTKSQQFFLWHEGICSYYEDGNKEQALSLLNEALSLTTHQKQLYSEREIEILISLGNIYSESKDYPLAIKNFKVAHLQLTMLLDLTNNYLPIRLYYNYSRALRYNREYQLSLKMCNEGIMLTKKYNFLYLKGDLYYQKGINYMALQNFEKAKENFKLAEMVYLLEGNSSSHKLVELMKEKLKEK